MNERILLREISDAEKAVSGILASFWQDDGLAMEHLERAKAHLNEAWIAADGQNARTVQKLVEDIESYTKLFTAVAEAPAGTEFQIGGKTFVKQPEAT